MSIVKPLLGVNIDHVATLRQVRLATYPDPVEAAICAERGQADGITVHLREDRRHIQVRDVAILQQTIRTRLNLEMAVTDEMLGFAEYSQPTYCCFVPEKRQELTTEGGLAVHEQQALIKTAVQRLSDKGIIVSLFIDPDLKQIEAALAVRASTIEIHTGAYAAATTQETQQQALQRIVQAVQFASQAGLTVNAGHGLNYDNVQPIAQLPQINELNIGHSIIARAIFVGLEKAVSEMKQLMIQARRGT